MNKISVLSLSALLSTTALFAAPTLENVTLTADALPGTLRVSYALSGESAIVTAKLIVDGDYLPDARFTDLIGDVNKEVATGTRSFTWRALETLPSGSYDASRLSVEVKAWPLSAPPPYMVRHFGQNNTTPVAGAIRYYETPDSLPGVGGVTNNLYKTAYLVFRYVDAGGKSFQMGTPENVSPRQGFEVPRKVTLTQDFWLGVFPLTQAQWANGWNGKRLGAFKDYDDADLMPATKFSYYTLGGYSACNTTPPRGYDGDAAMDKIRKSLGCSSLKPPTEAQWEFACRAGTTGAAYAENVDDIAWYADNSDGHPHPVGLKQPNAWGFYDMIGNVWEMTDDWFCAFPGKGDVTDPNCAGSGATYSRTSMGTCVRGGDYRELATGCRCARRNGSYENNGITDWHISQDWLGIRLMIPVSTVRGTTEPTVETAAYSGSAFGAAANDADDSEPTSIGALIYRSLTTETIPFTNIPNPLCILLR